MLSGARRALICDNYSVMSFVGHEYPRERPKIEDDEADLSAAEELEEPDEFDEY